MHQQVEPLFVAQQHGNAYRGEVLDGKTYQILLITAHLYVTEAIAKVAARRMWEAQQAEVAA
jgi:hypothetical protein